jgi:NADH-quinone oxidoreductase subunit M
MNDYSPLLWIALVVPAIGAVLVAALGPRRGDLVRWAALATTLLALVLVAIFTIRFATAPPPLPEAPPDRPAWAKTFHPEMETVVDVLSLQTGRDHPAAIRFYIGLDGLNIWLVALTAVLLVPSVLVSWKVVTERINEYFAWMLLLEAGLLGVFLSFDIILFYAFFELTLVPLFFLIGIWGGPQRQHAARKFFIYTLTGSLITLLGVLGAVLACYTRTGELTFAIPRLVEIVQQQLASSTGPDLEFWRSVQLYVFLGLMAGFAVKVPLVPLHTWLPLAHVEAPTAGSVLLAGVLLKLGTYGFLRLALPLAPDTALSLGTPLIGSLAVIGIIYGAFCSLAQNDIKKLVAYSSVSHLGICMLGMFALNETGLGGSLIQMINHGLSTGGLFLLVGMLYERYHTRLMADYGGMAAKLKLLGVGMVFICLSSAGLPGLNGFWGEVLSLMGIASVKNLSYGAIAGQGLSILGVFGTLLLLGLFLAGRRSLERDWPVLLAVGVVAVVWGVIYRRFLDQMDVGTYSLLKWGLRHLLWDAWASPVFLLGLLLLVLIFLWGRRSVGRDWPAVFAAGVIMVVWAEIYLWQNVWGLGVIIPGEAVLCALGATGVVLGAWYLLTMLRRVFFGPVKEPRHEGPEPIRDLNGRELAALLPIGVLCVVLGVYPQPFFDAAQRDLKVMADIADAARGRVETRLEVRAAAPAPAGEEMR